MNHKKYTVDTITFSKRRKRAPPKYYTLTPEAVASVAPLSRDIFDPEDILRLISSQIAAEEEELLENLKKSLSGPKVVNELYYSKCSLPEHKMVIQLWKNIRESGSAELVTAGELFDTIAVYLSSTVELGVGDTGNVVWSYGCGPTEFSLKWVIHIGVSGLLTAWLTAKAAWNDLPRVASPNVGDMVVAESDIDNNWYRAKVLELKSNGVIKCKYIDYGNVEYNFPDRLRAVPDELLQIPGFAFEASLSGLAATPEDIDGEDVHNFLVAVKSASYFRCTLVALMDGKYEVNLARETDTEFNTAIQYAKYGYQDDDEPAYPYNPEHPLDKELQLLRFRNEELFLPRRPERQVYNVIKVRIHEAVDPSELYVEILDHQNNMDAGNLKRDMNAYYESHEGNLAMEIRTDRLLKGRVYAWRNPETELWERVEVKRVDTPPLIAVISRLDFGNTVLALKSDLREMVPWFCHLPSLVEAAHLVHVRPPNNRNYWTAEEVLYFKRLIKLGNIFEAFILSTEAESYNSLQHWNSLGLMLFFHDNKKSVSVQSILVGQGIADGSGVSAGSPFLPKVGASHMFKSDVLSDGSNSNGYNTFWGPGLIESEDQYSPARELSTSVLCLDEILFLKKAELTVEGWKGSRIPSTIRLRLGWISISHVIGPAHFYIQMQHTLPFLSHLMTKLGTFCASSTKLQEADVRKGIYVSVEMAHESVNETCLPPTWNRAFVLDYNPRSKHAKVILVDFGITMFTPIDKLRPLPDDYLKIPAFCARCHLADPNVEPIMGKWSSEVNKVFTEYLQAYRIEFPIYFAYVTSRPFKYDLESYSQEMAYDSEKKEWVPDPNFRNPYTDTDWMKSFASDVLLKHLFVSNGISVDYEEPISGIWHAVLVPNSDGIREHIKTVVQKKKSK